MHKQLDKILCETFPSLYRHRIEFLCPKRRFKLRLKRFWLKLKSKLGFKVHPWAYTDPCVMKSCMPFGFEVGDGWFLILWKLSQKLEPLGVSAVQVKEKFGALRFYINHHPDEAHEAILAAEKESADTCEMCGKPGKMNDNGWISCLCQDCCKDDRFEIEDER